MNLIELIRSLSSEAGLDYSRVERHLVYIVTVALGQVPSEIPMDDLSPAEVEQLRRLAGRLLIAVPHLQDRLQAILEAYVKTFED